MLQLFETFCAVAETGSLSKAAEALHITQPAVTRQIKALEQELGAVLLTRTSHGVALTPVGQQVLGSARKALAAVAAAKRAAAESAGGEGRLAVASGNMVMQFIVAPVLADFKAERPNLQVEIHTGHYQDCLDRLSAYEVDLALISTLHIPAELKARPLFTDPVVAVASPRSPLAARAEISLTELEGATLLVLPRAAGLRQQLSRVLTEANVRCHLAEHSTVETIKTMVGLEIGVSLLPRSAVAEEVAQGRLAAARVRDWPDEGRPLLAVTRGEGAVPAAAAAFIKALRERYGGSEA